MDTRELLPVLERIGELVLKEEFDDLEDISAPWVSCQDLADALSDILEEVADERELPAGTRPALADCETRPESFDELEGLFEETLDDSIAPENFLCVGSVRLLQDGSGESEPLAEVNLVLIEWEGEFIMAHCEPVWPEYA